MTIAQLRRLRWAVRAVLMLGVAASVTANVLHAHPNPIARAIAAWPPLALLLTVELIGRVPVHSRALSVARIVATAVIAGIAAWVSYWHMASVAARYGETGASPYLLPLSVDGLVIVASVCLVELAGRIAKPAPALPVRGMVFDHARPIGPEPAQPAEPVVTPAPPQPQRPEVVQPDVPAAEPVPEQPSPQPETKAVPLGPDGEPLEGEALREHARKLYRQSVKARKPLSQRELGRRVGMSQPWAKVRIDEVAGEQVNGHKPDAVPVP